ncbi:hypothetical protein [Ekhidna sp.]|uniref:hypothetical protein n=1 Tax=Ekhidna sp. TaxID=2608089 RepID=UPI003517D52D
MNHPYIDELILSCQMAKVSKPVNKYVITSLSDLVKLDKVGNAIYIISEVDGNPERTYSIFEDFKSRKERACAKLNTPSMVLYVGSSTTGIKNRLKQHLYEGPNRTYALHMKHWFSGSYKVDVLEFDVPIEVLQIIEDSISHNLKPAFGKQGSNNK